MKSIQNIFNITSDSPQKFVRRGEIDEKTIFHIFSQIITEEYGEMGKKNITPVLYKEKSLFVAFSQSLWAQEVWMNRAHLIKRVNDRIGALTVYKIRAHR